MSRILEDLKTLNPSSFAYCDSPFACAAAPLISRKWVPVIVCHLLHGSKHFNELRRAIPFLSAKVLSENLLVLESEGILAQETSRTQSVSYKLTAKGEDLSIVIRAMNDWGRKWLVKPITIATAPSREFSSLRER